MPEVPAGTYGPHNFYSPFDDPSKPVVPIGPAQFGSVKLISAQGDIDYQIPPWRFNLLQIAAEHNAYLEIFFRRPWMGGEIRITSHGGPIIFKHDPRHPNEILVDVKNPKPTWPPQIDAPPIRSFRDIEAEKRSHS